MRTESGRTKSAVPARAPVPNDISYDERAANFSIAARTSSVGLAFAGSAASISNAPSAPVAIDRIKRTSLASVGADVPDHAEVALRERAERDQRLGCGDPRVRRDPLGHQIAQLVVLPHPDERDQVVRTRDAVALGHPVDLEQLLRQ